MLKYWMYRLSFPNGIHIGEHNLDESLIAFKADTLFSALFMEALKTSEEKAGKLLLSAKEGALYLSDAFPYIGSTEYLPKPACSIQTEEKKGDSVLKKALKSLAYIPMKSLDQYLNGSFDAVTEKERLSGLGVHDLKVSAAIAGQEQTMPYHVGSFHFQKGNGLYVIIAAEEAEKIEGLMRQLSFAGIGGKKSAGYGRFCIDEIREFPADPFVSPGSLYMSLGVCLPTQDEIKTACDGASFQVLKRSGFVASETYDLEQRKKKDIYVMAAGSCFQNKFDGDVYDISDGGNHPVYRYAKPIFWRLRR